MPLAKHWSVAYARGTPLDIKMKDLKKSIYKIYTYVHEIYNIYKGWNFPAWFGGTGVSFYLCVRSQSVGQCVRVNHVFEEGPWFFHYMLKNGSWQGVGNLGHFKWINCPKKALGPQGHPQIIIFFIFFYLKKWPTMGRRRAPGGKNMFLLNN